MGASANEHACMHAAMRPRLQDTLCSAKSLRMNARHNFSMPKYVWPKYVRLLVQAPLSAGVLNMAHAPQRLTPDQRLDAPTTCPVVALLGGEAAAQATAVAVLVTAAAHTLTCQTMHRPPSAFTRPASGA